MKVSYIVPEWLVVWADEMRRESIRMQVEPPKTVRTTKTAGNVTVGDAFAYLNISRSGKAWHLFCVGSVPPGMKFEGEGPTPMEAVREAIEAFQEYVAWPGRIKTTHDETAAQ